MAREDRARTTDYHPDNPWGSSDVWQHLGTEAVGRARAYAEASRSASSDADWLQAEEIAGQVFDMHFDTGRPIHDAGLLAALDAAIVPILFALIREAREKAVLGPSDRVTSPQGETAKPTVFPNNTNSVAEASPQGDLGVEDLREIVEIFKQARRGLTEDSKGINLTAQRLCSRDGRHSTPI